MSIQRYSLPYPEAVHVKAVGGEYVLYADHVAAMEAEAESAHDLGVIYGINHERARIRQAVEALYDMFDSPPPHNENAAVWKREVLSIIDGDK